MDGGRGNLRRRRRAPLGCAREREQRARERAESEGEERGVSGRLRGALRRAGRRGGSRSWRARGDHAPLLLLAGGGRRQEPGRWAGLATWAAGKAQVRFSLSSVF